MRVTSSRLVTSAIVALALLVLLGCQQKPIPVDHQELAERLGVTLRGTGKSLSVTLPQDLASDAQWGLKQEVVLAGGFDLRPYAGTDVELVSYTIKERLQSEPLDLWLVMSGGHVVGAYAAVRAGSDLSPGVFSVADFKSPQSSLPPLGVIRFANFQEGP